MVAAVARNDDDIKQRKMAAGGNIKCSSSISSENSEKKRTWAVGRYRHAAHISRKRRGAIVGVYNGMKISKRRRQHISEKKISAKIA